VLTIPCAAVVGALMETLTRLPGGVALVAVATAVIATTAFAGRSVQSRRLRAGAAQA
jgi:hypothetical protein